MHVIAIILHNCKHKQSGKTESHFIELSGTEHDFTPSHGLGNERILLYHTLQRNSACLVLELEIVTKLFLWQLVEA